MSISIKKPFLFEKNKRDAFHKKIKNIHFLFFYYHYFCFNRNISYKFRNTFLNTFSFIYLRNSSISRLHNYCFINGRPRGVFGDFNMSRVQLRFLASKGLLSGLKKASW